MQTENTETVYRIQFVDPAKMEWVFSYKTYASKEDALEDLSTMREVGRVVEVER